MSADDSIEIEFPSLKQTAPNPVERVTDGRAPGPIEAQLSKKAESDDLSWLTAIFAEDDPDGDPDEAGVVDPYEASAGDRDRADPEGIDDETAATVARLLPDTEQDDRTPPRLELNPAPREVAEVSEPSSDHPAGTIRSVADVMEPALTTSPTPDVEVEDPEPDLDDHEIRQPVLPEPAEDESVEDAPDPLPAKKATGFREEIMSTFSQMYS